MSSGNSRSSKIPQPKPARSHKKNKRRPAEPVSPPPDILFAAVGCILSLIAFAAVAWFASQGDTLAYGDAEAHLNIARRIWDNPMPEYREIGTVWLPLPHLLMLPFTYIDSWYHSGLAGALPSALAWILAGLFLFSSVRRLTDSTASACCALAVFAGNPNLLYLASAPMTEPIFFASVFGLVRALIAFHQHRSHSTLAFAVIAVWCAALTRYEGWLLIPVAAVILAWRDIRIGAAFAALASIAPLYWLAHNWWLYGDALEFYRGEWSARAIYDRSHGNGFAKFPGEGNLSMAWTYLKTALELALGQPLCWITVCGLIAALWKRWFGLVALLAALPAFVLWSMISGGGVEIFVPTLWPYTHYNSRYALSALPFAALCAAAIPAVIRWPKLRAFVATTIAVAAILPWLAYPNSNNWIVWKEAQVNSASRREYTHQMAAKFAAAYQPHDRIAYAFGDLTAILREAHIPLMMTLQDGNQLHWLSTIARPDLFLNTEWVLDFADGPVAKAVKATGKRYEIFASVSRGRQTSPVLLFRRMEP